MKIHDPYRIWSELTILALGLLAAALILGADLDVPIDHQLDALRAAQVRSWTADSAVERGEVCPAICPCSCGALAFCGGDE